MDVGGQLGWDGTQAQSGISRRSAGEYHIPKDRAAGPREVETALEERRAQTAEVEYKKLRRGWCPGSESFRKELLGQMKHRLGAEHYGAQRQETVEEPAEAVVVEEMKRRRWDEGELG